MTQSDEVPEGCHFDELRVEFGRDFFEEELKVAWHVLDCAAMEKDEVEHLGALVDVFLPLSLLADATACLGKLSLVDSLRLLGLSLGVVCLALSRKIFKQVDETTIFDV